MRLPMVFVQARMASQRFPGKALAPLGILPVIERVLYRCGQAMFPADAIVVCAPVGTADDPLGWFVRQLGHPVFRGASDDVVARFRWALRNYPCDRFFRVCGDSPLLDPALFARFLKVPGNPDLVTNVFPRTFPKGQSLELIRTDTFLRLDTMDLTVEQREHPTRFFYDHPHEFTIVNVENENPTGEDVAVDTVEDLHRIEGML